MNYRLIALRLSCLLVTGLLGVADGECRTWWVKRDGSGHFATIQPAVDGAAPGDTIRIGMGRFAEYRAITAPGGWTENINVSVSVDSLTMIGLGLGTVIGPTGPTPDPTDSPRGIMIWSRINCFRLENLRLENNEHNLDGEGHHLEVRSCVFSGGDNGIIASGDQGVWVRDCQFYGTYDGVITYSPCADALVGGCTFQVTAMAVVFSATTGAEMVGCRTTGGRGGVDIQERTSGAVISRCIFEDVLNYAIRVTKYSSATLTGNVIRGSAVSLGADWGAAVSGTGNIFGGGSFTTLQLAGVGADLHGNHILHSTGASVLMQLFPNLPVTTVDLTGNYWGSVAADSIAAWIRDYEDDPSVKARVQFVPFAAGPVPAEAETLGGLKGRFR